MKKLLLLSILALSACGGGGGNSIPHGSSTATPAPSNTTAAPQGNHLAAAPATVYTSTGPQSLTRAQAQAIHTKSVNLGTGGIPTVVVGYSATMGSTFSNTYAWAENAQSTPMPEASGTATTSSNAVTIASFQPDNVNLFASTYDDWLAATDGPYATGQIALQVTFSDGTSGNVPYLVYDHWNMGCNGVSTPNNPMNWGYQSGVPVGQIISPDVSIDCSGNVTFANGALLQAPAQADAYGNLASFFSTITTASAVLTTNITTISNSQIQVGAVYLMKTTDGGCAKVMWLSNNSAPTEMDGLSMRGMGPACFFPY